jgi:putative phosphonate metabolism protein
MAVGGARYAIYYAPEPGSPLAAFAASWLGRDPESGVKTQQPVIPGLPPERLMQLTADPRRYGFHGTLKAPIRLAAGTNVDGLDRALATFAGTQRPFYVPPLRVQALGSFLALTPGAESAELRRLADECVIRFDSFRAPPEADELEKRRANGLSARQEAHLARWGYPHVFEDFRFHLTLTGRIPDEAERRHVLGILTELTEPFCRDSLAIPSVCLFEQQDDCGPFLVRARYAFGNSSRGSDG